MGEFDEPFCGTEALARKVVTSHRLRGMRRLHRNVYIHPASEVTALRRARAAWLWAGGDGVLAGWSAAAVHGSRWIDPRVPAELVRTRSRRGTDGIRVRGDVLADGEVCTVDGMAVTTPDRTGFDLARWLRPRQAVEQLDALCRVTRLDPVRILRPAESHAGERGVGKVRIVVPLVDPGAESLPETRVRLLLVNGGLPVPETQLPIRDEERVVGWADMGWRKWRTIVEYDGVQHWTDERQRTKDIERYDAFVALGWSVIRVNSEQLRTRPRSIVERVRRCLREAGARV
ncbi:MAG: DUF559 domain-containing protein [Rhodococcus sp. (in: high G+C Gram-positive bacteria)]|uniref:DUF559 domain-containing protein n=1 Tax=Rhodococcus sp. TaxID=1831 RepID=UPI003BB7F340